ncbi:hypothetical protein [Hymenobacter norwichensis]|uniref:hypothetical protein n=1 Tax=Hymenobacter norwichensis TaxID=223903 RepID=UPI0003B4EFBF|nr:hypothetical protein [Hymenobacter norwichensis]
MSILLLGQLRDTLTSLDTQNTTFYSLLAQHTLRQQLSATIKTLHAVYPDGMDTDERRAFIAVLLPLEQQFLQLTLVAPVAVPLATWQAVHGSLQKVITEALALLK